jgi:non-ribosomal peptide synthetase component F
LVREITALYRAFHSGEPSPLPCLPIQYADYAVWQRATLDQAIIDRELAFWKHELAGAPPFLDLPTDHPRPLVQTQHGDAVHLTIPALLTDRVRALSRARGATLFMSLLAAFDVVLARYTHQDTVVVGTPVAGRTRAETEGLIGFFINSLALRADVRGPFLEFLAQVKERTLNAFAHQLLPFDFIVNAIVPQRDLARPPVFQVFFGLHNTPAADLALDGVVLSPITNQGELMAKFELELSITEAGDCLECTFLFNRDLFNRSTIERLARTYARLLQAIVENPDTHV